MENNLEELLGLSRTLTKLLEDPHFGLSTWHEAVANALDAIVEFRTGKVPGK